MKSSNTFFNSDYSLLSVKTAYLNQARWLCISALIVVFTVINVQLSFGQSMQFSGFIPEVGVLTKSTISGVSMSNDGAVYFIDKANAQILKYSSDGKLEETIKRIQVNGIEVILKGPKAIHVDNKGRLIVYDEELGKILVHRGKVEGLTFGEKGSGPGNLDNITSITTDSDGYYYLLSADRKQIDVYDTKGRFTTWFTSLSSKYTSPIAISCNGYNEINVLDSDGASVIMLDAAGNMINSCRNLSAKNGVTLNKPISFTALKNGDFIILDASGSITHFSRLGDVVGIIGSKGQSSAGVFVNPAGISAALKAPIEFVVIDADAGRSQKFTAKASLPLPNEPVKKYRVNDLKTSKADVYLMHTTEDGTYYIIYNKEKENVYVYPDSSSVPRLIIKSKVSQPVAIRTSSEGMLYIIDGKTDDISIFDKSGIYLKRIGQDLTDKLKDPSDLALQKDGSLLLIDKSNGAFHRWNANGSYDKVIFNKERSNITSPSQIAVDSKDNIYILCEKQNAIFKVSPSGWPIQIKQLKARKEKEGKDAIINNFYIDPLDQIHLFNGTTQQVEVYTWQDEPVLKFHFGRSSNGFGAFGSSDKIYFDNKNYVIYGNSSKGELKAYKLFLQPPTPKGKYVFDANEDGLIVNIEKVNNSTVIGYALLTDGVNVNDSIASQSESETLLIRNDRTKYPVLKKYQLVSISPTDMSEPAEGFSDYYTYGSRLLQLENYEEGFTALQSAVQTMNCSNSMLAQIASNISIACDVLSDRGEVMKALPMVRYAFSIAPSDSRTKKSYEKVYYTYYLQLADRNEYGSIITETERLFGDRSIRPILLHAVDSLSLFLAALPNEKAINNAILLQKKMVEWDNDKPEFYGSLLYSHLKLYAFKKNSGTPEFELISILKEADKFGLMAVSGLKKQNKPYFEDQLLLLEVMNAVGRFEEVEQIVVQELVGNSYAMQANMVNKYRTYLAESYMLRGKYDLASNEYQKILLSTPDDVQVKEKLAESFIKGNKPEEARSIYLELMNQDRFNAHYVGQIGRIELMRKNYVEASFQLEKAIKLNPGDRSFYGPLAESFQGANNLQKAIDNYNIAIPFEESKLQVVKNKFSSEVELKDQLDILKRYLKNAAELCEQLNLFSAAIMHYKKLIQVDTQNGEAYYGLGRCNLNAGYIYDATNAFYSACRIEPNNETYTAAYTSALKARDKQSTASDPIDILEIKIADIYPSLHRNYSDIRLLPIGEIIIANNSSGAITPSSINVFVKDIMDAPTPVSCGVLVGYSNSSIPISAVFNDKILENINDLKKQIDIEIQYKVNGGQRTAKKSATFTLKGRNVITWKDKRRLSAFVSPSIEEFINYSREIDLRYRDEQTYGISRNILKAVQVYNELLTDRLVYSPDPTVSFATASINTDIQDFLQYPAETMIRKSGDCDDLVALYCCILENAGVSTAYIDIPGHVFMAFDTRLQSEDLVKAGIASTDVIIENERVWMPIETTLLGKGDFMLAWKEGASRYYQELIKGNFPELVTFHEARSVYVPSTYIPANFSPALGNSTEAISSYNTTLSKLLVKLKKGVITELENRYVTEKDNVFVKNKYATLLAQTGDLDNAERIYLEALELSPNNGVTLNNLGNLFYLRGNGDRAAGYYQDAIRMDARDGEMHINLAKALLLAGKKNEAQQAFDEAIKINSKLALKYLTLKNQLK